LDLQANNPGIKEEQANNPGIKEELNEQVMLPVLKVEEDEEKALLLSCFKELEDPFAVIQKRDLAG